MPILIRNDSPTGTINEERLQKRATKILSALGCEKSELSLWICSDEDITAIHGQYFGDPTPTNVISFSQQEGEYGDVDPFMLGDVVISYETAARDSSEVGGNVEDEVAYLMVHGILHLTGYDHEGERAADAPEMEAKEESLYLLIKDL